MKTIRVIALGAALAFFGIGGAAAKSDDACKAAFTSLDPAMHDVSDAMVRARSSLPEVPPPPGKKLPDFYMKTSCAAWARYDFATVLRKIAAVQAQAQIAGKKCPPREAQAINTVIALMPRAINMRLDQVRALCKASGYHW